MEIAPFDRSRGDNSNGIGPIKIGAREQGNSECECVCVWGGVEGRCMMSTTRKEIEDIFFYYELICRY